MAGGLLFASTAFTAPALADDNDIWHRDTLTGDWGGARTMLDNHGIDITGVYTGEGWANASGGMKRGATYNGRAELSIDADLDKLMGWGGGSFHVTGYQIHRANGGVGSNFTGSIGDPSNIEARPSTRLFTLWVQQNLFEDKLSVRIGQLAADDEFAISPTAGNLLNGTFGWPDLMAANLVNGGPAYPLATPGVRVQVNPTPELSILAAAFSGNPAGHNCDDDPQICDRHGTKFSMSGGTLWIAEAQYAINQGDNATGLPGVYKLGAWYQNAPFADQKFGYDGTGTRVTLASGQATDPDNHSGDQGLYAIADQTFWRSSDKAQSLAGFVRMGGAPSDRNLISFYVDGGLGYTGLIPGRNEDVLTLGVAYQKISKDAASFDKEVRLDDLGYPVRDQETVIELSYLAPVTPWLSMQPDLQYIVHPGGNVQNPENTDLDTANNAFVLGLRTTITF